VLDIDHGQYRLNGDLVCSWPSGPAGNAAVAITGEGVHFNLKGYTITRDDFNGRFLRRGIEVRGANAHVHNGRIVDINCPVVFTAGRQDCAGIRLIDAPGARINGMSLHNNTVGIILFGGDNANGSRIHGNDITGNLRIGIGLFGMANGAKVTGNDLSDTGGYKLPDGTPRGGRGYFGTSDSVSLIDNIANDCAAHGILLWGRADFPAAERNTVRDNTTLDNGFAGIGLIGVTEADRPRDNLVQSNTAFGNCLACEVGPTDLAEFVNEVGFPPDCLNTWKDNDFDFAGPDCIE
jgi:nitrous oxidase accessory protein NosD